MLSQRVKDEIRQRITESSRNWQPPYKLDKRAYGMWYIVDKHNAAMYPINLNGNSKQRNSQRKEIMRFVERCTLERLLLGDCL